MRGDRALMSPRLWRRFLSATTRFWSTARFHEIGPHRYSLFGARHAGRHPDTVATQLADISAATSISGDIRKGDRFS